MLPYYLLTLFVAVFGILLCERRKSPKNDLIFLAAVALAMCGMASLRSAAVGVDYAPYAEYFQLIAQKDLSFVLSTENGYYREILHSLLTWLVSRFTHDSYIYMGIYSSLIILLRTIAVRKMSASVWVSMFIYASFGFFGYALCTLRQELAISVAMFAIPYLQKKKPIPFVLITLAAGLFHKSLFILLPAYFLAWLPLNNIMLALYAAGTVVGTVVAKPVLMFVTQHFFNYYALGSEGEYYLIRGRSFQTAVIPILLCFVALIFAKKLQERNKGNLVLIHFAIWSGILFVMTINTFLYQRVALVFLPLAALLLLPEILAVVAPAPEALEQLEALKRDSSPAGKKQYVTRKAELRDAKLLYHGAIGFVIVAGLVYQIFLLEANRLNLVPYITFLL